MEALIDLPWRAYPGGVLIAMGVASLAWGLTTVAGSFRVSVWESARPIAFVSGMRLATTGMAVAGVASSWIWHQVWLLALALAFGGEELLESSFVLYVLRWARRRDQRDARANA